jgi:hypothetical protein
LLTRRRCVTAKLFNPLAQSSTIPARNASTCAEVHRRIHRSNVVRSSALTTNYALGRPVRIENLLQILACADSIIY